jgi:fused signal recognition particle receptor
MMLTSDSNKPAPAATPGGNLFSRLRRGLQRTQAVLFSDLNDLFTRSSGVDQELLDRLEEHLLMADVGVKATDRMLEALSARAQRKDSSGAGSIKQALQDIMLEILAPVEQPLRITTTPRPFVILVTGVNGAGKTTSIGKLAAWFRKQNHSIMLAAGDTFRAAAVEQLQTWGARNNVPVIAQKNGGDSAAVIFDALQSARAQKIDILIADTAGRLHTQGGLMDELKKIRRVITKFDDQLVPECLLVLDAGTGQNALSQVKQFNEAIGVTGLLLAKLDGTAKGGMLFALAAETGIPIRFLGVGEQQDDLQAFNSHDFITALLAPVT